ncbi:SPX domain-containing membrane protein OsI_21475-like isoform X1 [Curcuma longa]|uniref:SPX domain-containing membrane protein OsI_21475-like isoform X1 n=2 Tax=Curcuma longa TaxID=136217 RepID=UPI003D9F11A9
MQILITEMVNFGKKLMANRVQEWEKYYINYKLMKKKVKQYVQQMEQGGKERRHVLKEFSRMLDDQIEKTVLFFLEQQGIIAHRIQELGEERTVLLEQPVISKISRLREAYIEVGHDLLKLLRFVEMNATGIRKILKKFDKSFGYKFTDYYISTRSNHPYSQLQQVFKHVGIAAVVGALSRNLDEIEERQGSSYLSLYDQPSTAMVVQDPVIYLIQESVDKLTHSTNFLKFLGQHALIHEGEEQVDERRYHFVSLLSNLVNTFLYMVNTYIIVPTADDYSMSLGAAATVCGIVIGSMAVAQVFSSVYFSAWSNKSYFRPLVFSSIVLFLGNTLYALAYDLNSLTILLIGRLLCGMGSARAVNRRYISDCVPNEIRMKASAGFVSASALGMACGPALAGLLQTNFKLYRLTVNQDTLPGWVMAFAWVAYLIWLWISFKEPVRDTKVKILSPDDAGHVGIEALETGLVQPLLNGSEQKQSDDGDEECNASEEGPEESHKPATSIASAYRLLTPSVKVQLLIYFMLKYAMEILLSESSVVSGYYFGWSTGQVAIFLAVLGLTVLPVNAIVGTYISNMFEDRQILLGSEILVLLGILLSFKVTGTYAVPQYVSSALITFVAAEVLEGVNLALLSQVMSSRLARGTYNGGLLSTEAGTVARVVADGTITLAGYLGESRLLNITLLPSLLICLGSIVATLLTYNSMY